jgi:23S rRNA pseudouridine2605 synthase
MAVPSYCGILGKTSSGHSSGFRSPTRQKKDSLTIEQLQAARAEKWRQKANPILTLEDAETWIDSIGVSLFLPRKAQLQSPAASFVEAVLGETNPTPAPAAIQNAFDLATRLFAAEKATPLNLLGSVSEQPDFLVSSEALPYVFAQRGDRDWKRGPRDKSSPLVIETWKLLKREGALTAPELQELLGREVTEAAVLRALSELWTALRVLPVYTAGEVTTWELFESRHQKAMQTGGGMAQATALSALVSLYLDSVIAATTDEIETFLSPLAPRSRIREVARGLAATQQLLTLPLGAQSLLYIAGGLPEFPEIEVPAETVAPPVGAAPQARERRRPFTPRTESERRPPRDGERRPFSPGDRPRRERPAFGERPAAGGARKSFSPGGTRSDGPRKEWQPRTGDRPTERKDWQPRREGSGGGFGKPYRSRTGDQPSGEKFQPREQERPPRREWKPREDARPAERKEWKPRRDDAGEGRREFRPRPAAGGKSFSKPYRSRTGEQRPAGKFSPGDRGQRPPRKEWKPREDTRPSDRKEWKPRRDTAGEGRPAFRPRPAAGSEGSGRPYRSRTGDQRPAGKFPPRDRDQQGPPRREWKPREDTRPSERKEWKPRREAEGGERREFRPRRSAESTERRAFKPKPSSGGAFRPRREGGGFSDRPKPAGEKGSFAKRPFESREGSDRKKPPQRERRAGGPGGVAGAKRAGKSFSKTGSKPGGKFGAPRGGKKSSFGAKRSSRPGSKPSFGKRPKGKKKSGE